MNRSMAFESTALLARGEAGIGKSTLLMAAACRREEEPGLQALHASREQSEAGPPFAGLHQPVIPLLGG